MIYFGPRIGKTLWLAILFLLTLSQAFDCSGTSRPLLQRYSGYSSRGQGHLREDVKVLQQALNAEGGYRLYVDGYFGWSTYQKVREWQQANYLSVDGIVGPNTWASLCDSSNSGGNSNSDLVFPIEGYSSSPRALNFGERRSNGSRCHAGCDLPEGTVLAVADGVVTNVYHFTTCSGGPVKAVLVYHADLDVTINYGEVDSGSVYVYTGQTIRKGDEIGYASRCKFRDGGGMLHFEVYRGRQTSNKNWYPPSGKTVGWGPNYCEENYLSTKPWQLMDCKDFIEDKF